MLEQGTFAKKIDLFAILDTLKQICKQRLVMQIASGANLGLHHFDLEHRRTINSVLLPYSNDLQELCHGLAHTTGFICSNDIQGFHISFLCEGMMYLPYQVHELCSSRCFQCSPGLLQLQTQNPRTNLTKYYRLVYTRSRKLANKKLCFQLHYYYVRVKI